MGGIANAEDAIEFMLAGATGVAVGAMNFVTLYNAEVDERNRRVHGALPCGESDRTDRCSQIIRIIRILRPFEE